MDKDERYFEQLDINHPLFKMLTKTEDKDQPDWWKTLLYRASAAIPLEDRLYINIRKDNTIDVYYQGGLLVSISYPKGQNGKLTFNTHYKYLSDDVKTEDKQPTYVEVKIDDLLGKNYECIKSRIKKKYSCKNESCSSEKSIQALLYCTGGFIDTEFAYFGFEFNDDKEDCVKKKDIRIDLLRYDEAENRLTFVELKREADSRLLRAEDKVSGKLPDPEILTQMTAYKSFVAAKSEKLEKYYRTLVGIGQLIGIFDDSIDVKTLFFNQEVELYIHQEGNPSKRRMERDDAIKQTLADNYITYTWPKPTDLH